MTDVSYLTLRVINISIGVKDIDIGVEGIDIGVEDIDFGVMDVDIDSKDIDICVKNWCQDCKLDCHLRQNLHSCIEINILWLMWIFWERESIYNVLWCA